MKSINEGYTFKTYKNTRELAFYHLRLPKEQSAFLYFLLESYDNLAFYSTLPHMEGSQYREIEVYSAIEHAEELERIWSYNQNKLQLQVLKNDIIPD